MYSARGLSARFVHTFGAIALVSGAVSIALFITSTVPAYAVPAAPAVVTLTQPDGRTIQARLYGDEWQHYTRTLDGRIIEQNAQGEWVTVGSGKPMPSPKSRERAAVADSPQVVPPFGTANVPVLCINFSDTSTQFATGDFDTLLFNGSSSMTAFYTENSYGQFTVAAGPSGIGGWYTASDTHDHYGTNGAGFDDFPAELVIEAVEAADAAGFDFGPYDSDGDGNVDVVAIIHQGTDEAAGGPSTDIWSHRSSLTSRQFFANDGTGPVTTGSGKVVDDYIIMPEHDPGDNLATIGVFAHEYGHALGLPDFYDRDSSSNGLGSWSLMAAGAWNGNAGDTPAHFDAWCKVQLGWVTPVVATSSILNAPLPEVETNQVIYQVFAPGSTTEYFLVENRQLTGFDSALPASGALIYHVDDTQALSQNDNEWRPGLTGSGNYQCAIEQADGMWQLERFRFDTPPGNNGDAGDPYPGTSGNRAYDDVSTPSATLYDGSDFPLVVRNISPSSAAMTIDIVDTMVPLVPRSIMASDTLGDEGGSITVTWSRSGDDGRGADDVAEYDVMRSLADTGPFAVIDTVPAGTTAVFDTNVVDGPPGYYYKVVTRDTSGLTSETKVVGPATSRDDLKPPAVDMLLVKDSQADNGRSMTLTWAGYQAPADLVSFRVYRSTAPFTDVNATDVDRIATVTELGDDEAPSVAITDPAARSYIDKAADVTDPTSAPLDLTAYWYAVTGLDEVGNEITAVQAVGPTECAPNLSINYTSGLQFITLPALPVNPAPMSVLGLSDPSDASLARYNPLTKGYNTLSMNPDDPFIQMLPGRGFWLERFFPTFIAVAGSLVEDAEYEVPLETGWNAVGSPYDGYYGFDAIMVRPSLGTDEPIRTSNALKNYGWYYDAFERSYKLVSAIGPPLGVTTLPKLQAMWINVLEPGAALVFNSAASSPVPLGDITTADAPALDGWQIQLIATAGDAADTDNYIGVSNAAAAIGKIAGPPAAIGGVDLYLTDAGSDRIAVDLVDGLKPGAKWEAVVECGTPDTNVQISWPDLTNVPHDVRPVLTDLASGRSVYMRTAANYSFRSRNAGDARQFEITFADADAGPVVSSLSAVPTRGGGAELLLTLGRAPESVTVEIRNVAGMVVQTVPVNNAEIGLNRVLWNGMGATGTKMPNGRYIMAVTAVALDNQETARAISSVTIER